MALTRAQHSYGSHMAALAEGDERGITRNLFVHASVELRCETSFGETVYLVGNTSQLGCWVPDAGVKLGTCKRSYPIWRADPLLLADAAEIEYKFVVVDAQGGARWEPLDHNRKLSLEASELRVVADWGSTSTPHHTPMTEPPKPTGAVGSPPLPASAADRPADASATAPPPPAAPERLIVVQHRLPIRLQQQPGGGWSLDWDESALLATSAQGGRHLMGSLNLEVLFVGCPNVHVPEEAQAEVRALLLEHSCVPVFLGAKLSEGHSAYATEVMWPLLHHQIPDRQAGGKGGDGARVSSLFDAYKRANDAFASTVKSLLRSNENVWVHSSTLLLVPLSLRKLGIPHDTIISLFLHTPFPSPEIWRVLPHRTTLLHGMLASDVIGFHLFEYARHFNISCRRLLGLGENVGGRSLTGGVLSIDIGSRIVKITVSHIGLERDVICDRLSQPEVKVEEEKLRKHIEGRTVIGGLEKLNNLQGVLIKLLAHEQLLQNYPMWRSRLTLLQVCIPDAERPVESKALSEEVRKTADRIRKTYGAETVHYLEVGVEIPKEEWTVTSRLALFRVVDVLLNCAMKDGLNLLPFEYVLTKSVQETSGVIVLSEFVGCSHVLNGGMRVNPFNLEHVVEQLDAALAMPSSERAARLAKDYKFVCDNTTASWLRVAVQDMREVRSAAAGVAPVSTSTRALCGWGSRLKEGGTLAPLSAATLLKAYRSSGRRVILLGLDGTLIQQEKVLAHLKAFHDFQGHTMSPPPVAIHCLRALAADPHNVVYVISGRSAPDMEACLGDIPNLGLAAELGFKTLAPHSAHKANGTERTWAPRDLTDAQANWRDLVRPLLEWYTIRTNGAFTRWQESAALWCYYDADPDFGRFQARHLTEALRDRLKGAGLHVVHSLVKGRVEVRIAGVNKGAVADDVIRAAEKDAPVDFVLCIGDDDEDEYMLSATTARAGSLGPTSVLRSRLFTVTVGAKPASHAQYLVSNSSEVMRLLETVREPLRMEDGNLKH